MILIEKIVDLITSTDSSDNEFEPQVRRPRVFKERRNYLLTMNNEEFKKRFRLSKNAVVHIIDQIRDKIAHRTDRNNAVSPENQVLLTLRFYALGTIYQAVGDFVGVSTATAGRIIPRVTHEIAKMRKDIIRMPSTQEEINQAKLNFFSIAKFPRVIGVIDCTHVKILSPGGDNAEIFRNRKGYFSINVQIVAGADLKIKNIVARWPGSAHDSNIFSNSRIRAQFEDNMFGDALLLGDSGYGVSNYMMTILNEPRTEGEQLYNESLIRTRNTVERLFGVLKRRFPIISLGIKSSLELTQGIIVACAVLHNIARDFNEEELEFEEGIQQLIKL
ncbi:unnamed protein product [Macrosiphum euphorbiae]|uniref:Putative nuclease HARBI1 n=1 Tax=Macrosiphum euphorbiae TaxID=13131 RepID=A0AAV0Y6V9_9HEMI|nr:unnamed protein product [Macrosiphum euphorbiae]